MTTYNITNMRVLVPSAKTRESNPDLAFTVKGNYSNEAGEKLSFTSKPVSNDDVKSADFLIDLKKGILTLPSGQRGRKAAESLSEAEVTTLLAAIRENVTAA